MSWATVLYIGMLVLLGVGLEGIRRIGNTLTPPRHIAGTWRITVSSSSSCPFLEFREAEEAKLEVEQSGRYLTLNFSDVHRTQLRARFDDGEVQGGGLSTVPCAMGAWVHVSGRLAGDHLEIVLTRAQEASEPAGPALILSVTRPSHPDSHPSVSP